MKYTDEDFEKDKSSPEMLHIRDHERYVAFYEELGKDTKQYRPRPNGRVVGFIRPVGNSILDLGCNVGRYVIHFAQQGYQVVGVDIADTLLMEARKRKMRLSEKVARRITFIHSDIMNLNGIGRFDTIILTEVLEHVIDPFAVLKKCVEDFMKPTSKIFITAPAERIGIYAHVRGVPQEWLREAGTELGLNLEFSDYVCYPVINNKQRTIKTRAIGTLT